MRRGFLLVLTALASCTDEGTERASRQAPGAPATATADAASASTGTPRVPRRERGGKAAAEPPAASPEDGGTSVGAQPPTPPTPLTPETLEAQLRGSDDGTRPSTLTAAAIRADERLVRAAMDLLASSNDARVLDGLRLMFARGALGGHEGTLSAGLLRALWTEGDPMRRLAALAGLGIDRGAWADPLRAVIFERLPLESSPQVVQVIAQTLRRGTLAPTERTALIDCAQRLDVPFDNATPARQPARLARRMVYEELAADAVRRDDWGPLLARMDALRIDAEREDLIAGLAVMGDYVSAPDAGTVGSPERQTLLETRRANLSRLYRATNGAIGRRRMISSAREGLGILPDDEDAPEDERRAAAALLRDLIAFETDPETIGTLRGAISHMGMDDPAAEPR